MSYPEIHQAFWTAPVLTPTAGWGPIRPGPGGGGRLAVCILGPRRPGSPAGGRRPGDPHGPGETGFWSVFVPGLAQGDCYQYRVTGADGTVQLHADPYGFASQLRPARPAGWPCWIFPLTTGNGWPAGPKAGDLPSEHLRDARRQLEAQGRGGRPRGLVQLEELARELIPWLKEHNFTHVELLPLAEHPFDGSWGYQTTGYFAVTSRYGTPAQFAAFGQRLPPDGHRGDHGLCAGPLCRRPHRPWPGWDGTYLYEYDSDVGQSEWGTCNFNYYRGEVRSFLNSACSLWMDVYHCDGIRMDAISRAVYWLGDPARGGQPGGPGLSAEPQPRPEPAVAHRHLHRRGLHQLPENHRPHPLRRGGL